MGIIFKFYFKFHPKSLRNVLSNFRYYTTSTDTENNYPKNNNNSNSKNSFINIARLPKKYHDRMLHILEPTEKTDQLLDEKRLAYGKKLFAMYGTKSGVNPSSMWPSEEELDEIIEFEKEYEPSLEIKLSSIKESKEAEMKEMLKKEDNITKQLKKMPRYIGEYVERLEKVKDQEDQLQKKRQELLEQARDHFGYDIDPSDPRFEQLKLEKEAKEQQMKKEKKKKKLLAEAITA